MTVFLNSSTGGDLNPGFDGSGGPVATAVGIPRRGFISSNLGLALATQVAYGWDQVSGSARLVLPFPSGALGDPMTVTTGAVNMLTGAGNPLLRFSGTVRQFDTTAYPHTVTAMGKGPLYALEEFKTDVESQQDGEGKPGLDFADLVGSNTATLQQIVTAVLGRVGITYSLSNFDNPSHVYGVDALGKPTFNDALVWGTHESAASYLHRFFEASAGYRLFDSSDGNVYFKQITATPAGTPDATFTLGVDIFGDSSAQTSSLGKQTAVLVEGWDDGSGPATSGIVGSGASAFRSASNLIETDAFAAEIANFWLPQVNRNQRLVRLTTPRDDLIGPGSTIFIDAAGLGVTDTMWVKSLTTEVEQNGQFTQRLVCVAGAA